MPLKPAHFRVLASLALAAAIPLAFSPAPALAATSADSTMFILKKVTFVGNQRVSTDTLNSVIGITPGQKVNRDSIVQAFNNVVAEYKKENVGGTIQPTMRTQAGHVSVEFDIKEAAPVAATVVNPIIDHETFTGNQKVSTDKLQAALALKPGQEVTKDLLVNELASISKVYKAAHVGAEIKPVVTDLSGGHVDVNFEIIEGNQKKKS